MFLECHPIYILIKNIQSFETCQLDQAQRNKCEASHILYFLKYLFVRCFYSAGVENQRDGFRASNFFKRTLKN